MLRSIAATPRLAAAARSSYRTLSILATRLAKNDSSTIDSYKLPSQTSINEWEFKYDFVPKVAEPKVPPVSKEAIQQEKAQVKKQQVEKELLSKEQHLSIKVEANHASVVHGGEAVGAEPELLQDRASEPVDAQSPVQEAAKIDSSKYQQLSLNENINNSSVVNMSQSRAVDHNSGTVDVPPEIHDAEEAEKATQKPSLSAQAESGFSPVTMLAVLGLGGVAGYFAFNGKEKK